MLFMRRQRYDKELELVIMLLLLIPLGIYYLIKYCIICGIDIYRLCTRNKPQKKYDEYYEDISQIDLMDGFSFEQFVGDLLKRSGYKNVYITKCSGDFGVDITAEKNGQKWAFQCKNYASKLGVSPIQEVYSGAVKYNASVCVVITNSYFTAHAQELAKTLGVFLWDRDELIKIIKETKHDKAEPINKVGYCSTEKKKNKPLINNKVHIVKKLIPLIKTVWTTLKKPLKKITIALIVCAGAIVLLSILVVLTDTATWCKHEYTITKEIPATCIAKGEIHKHCTQCENEKMEYLELIPHQWVIADVLNPTCTNEGYTTEKCEICFDTQITNIVNAIGHSMKETYKLNPTPSTDGKVISRCERCEYYETEVLPKLENDNNEKTKEHIEGKQFSFQFKGSTAMSFMKKFCNRPGHIHLASTFYGTPTDLSYLDAIRDHSDSNEILWGEYYTITATVTLGDYDYDRTRISCSVRSNNIVVGFTVDFREGFEDEVDLYDRGDVITFRGKFYDEGCGFTDAVLITE